jgi:hypothetical protein
VAKYPLMSYLVRDRLLAEEEASLEAAGPKSVGDQAAQESPGPSRPTTHQTPQNQDARKAALPKPDSQKGTPQRTSAGKAAPPSSNVVTDVTAKSSGSSGRKRDAGPEVQVNHRQSEQSTTESVTKWLSRVW